jgi:uncharacterized protein (UPF0332 family)
MNSEMQSSDYWEEIELDSRLVNQTLDHAIKDIETAKKMDLEECDWAYAIAYNGLLQAGRALMYLNKVRPKGQAKHYAIVEFLRKNYLDNLDLKEGINYLDRSRRKRHLVVYEQRGIISEEEVSYLIAVAEKFISRIKKIIKG